MFICDALGVSREDALRMACEKTGMQPAMVARALAVADTDRFSRVRRAFYEAVLELCRQRRGGRRRE